MCRVGFILLTMVSASLILILNFFLTMASDPREFLNSLGKNEDIQKKINNSYDSLFSKDDSGRLVPFVCSVCDEVLMRRKDVDVITVAKMKTYNKLLSWSWLPESERIPVLESAYRFSNTVEPGTGNDQSWLNGYGLSPRGTMHQMGRNKKLGFTCCSSCKKSLEKSTVPRHAIVNRNHVGMAPDCLKELTDVEVAFLSPVKSYGYCFLYQGGSMKCMKGTLVFMRVKERKLAKSVTTLKCMGLNEHVVVLLSGKMTKNQKNRVLSKTKVRTDKLIAAVEWLVQNHTAWRDIDLDVIRDEISRSTPIVVDKATNIESSNARVEKEEVFTCYYPDSAADAVSGGFDTPGAFKDFVTELQEKNYDIELKAELEKSFVRGSDDEILLGGALLQFPYGIGGLDESRQIEKGQRSKKTNLDEFLDHLSKKAAPEFQTPLFQLILYSLKSKKRLLQSSRLQLRNKADAEQIAQGFKAEDLSATIKGRRNKDYYRGSKVSRRVLQAVDACSKSLPHTPEAAKRARSSVEALQHHFGGGSVFLTVTPDDENSFLIEVLSDVRVDDNVDISSLSDDELSRRASNRQELRFKFPGMAALNFEMILDIVMEEVIGWDVDKNCPKKKPGLFGHVKAIARAIEEQGRKTLHAHFILWIEGYDDLQKQMFFGSEKTRRVAAWVMQEYHDHIASATLFPTNTTILQKAFDHDGCTIGSTWERELPDVVDTQELRHMRHKIGCKENEGVFASCPHCDKTWTYKQLYSSYLSNVEGITDTVTVREEDDGVARARLLGEIVSFQRPNGGRVECPEACINVAYQAHASCHAKSCFKCNKLTGKRKREHKCGPKCECRFRLPDKRRKTTVVKTEREAVPWYEWSGEEKQQPFVSVLPKRGKYDLFQNVCCRSLSQSKFSCNTNVSLITDGPIAHYICKYCVKPNDKDEVADYAEVDATMKKMTGRVHEENDRAEALRIICRAAFAHNKSNVISSTLASFLTRNDSRFFFSHDFVFCPLTDVVRLHNQQDVDATLRVDSNGGTFFENQALHYLCRPSELENVSLKDFVENYSIGYVTKRKSKDNPVIPFQADTGHFKHPSAKNKRVSGVEKVTCAQGVKLSEEDQYAKVPQWFLPDSCSFNTSILNCSEDSFNEPMERYSQAVLSLFLPHRSSSDLKVAGQSEFPYTKKLREVYENDIIRKSEQEPCEVFTETNVNFLQNIQNAARNSIRYKPGKDDLQSCTEDFLPEGVELPENDDSDEEDDLEEDTGYEEFLDGLGVNLDPPITDTQPEFLFAELKNFKFGNIRDKGDKGCGWAEDCEPMQVSNPENFVTTSNQSATSSSTSRSTGERRDYTVKEIVQVLLRRTTVSDKNVWQDKNIAVKDATGTVYSIREWAKAGFGKDRRQKRAFECIIASFLLTFYEQGNATTESAADPTISTSDKLRYRKARKSLLKLKGNSNTQLICLLHGPGGSGKSTVINMVKAYAKSYCESLGHQYTHRTIVTTAMSGVAATLLHGETATLAMHMAKKRIPSDEPKNWEDTRLVIVDEISFAAPADFERMHDCLKVLMQKRYQLYGGANIVFAGDYSQLEPVAKGQTVYECPLMPEFHHAVNCFIELDGKHRFRDDKAWGDRLLRFRQGKPTRQDIKVINQNCLVKTKEPPANIQVATYFNRNRDAVNSAVFEEWCRRNRPADNSVLQEAVVIFMDHLQMTNTKKTYIPVKSNRVKRFFYENCGENDCKLPESARGRVDPVLKLYPRCPMMHTKNSDVLNGQANGSRLQVVRVEAKVGEQPQVLQLDCGTKVRAFTAGQVECIVVEHESPDIVPRQFNLKTDDWTFSTKLEVGMETMTVKMKGQQFPIISNSCTTGHKLQGCTVAEILVNDFHYQKNWPYVVLSRVKTMNGLYLREPLSLDLQKYKMSPKMLKMLDHFRANAMLEDLTDEDYKQMIDEELRGDNMDI